MTTQLSWLNSHVGSIEDGIALINQFYWNITLVNTTDGRWLVFSGEKVLLKADTREQVDIFLYGMALAYSVIPNNYKELLREEFNPE